MAYQENDSSLEENPLLMPDRGQRRIAIVLRANRKATVTQINTRCNQDMQKSTLDVEGLQLHKTTLGATPVN